VILNVTHLKVKTLNSSCLIEVVTWVFYFGSSTKRMVLNKQVYNYVIKKDLIIKKS